MVASPILCCVKHVGLGLINLLYGEKQLKVNAELADQTVADCIYCVALNGASKGTAGFKLTW